MVKAKSLAPMAMKAMPSALAQLRESKKRFVDSVYVFFDASCPPGKGVAAAALVNQNGMTLADAEVDVARLTDVAKARGHAFTIGAMFSPENIVQILSTVADDPADVARIEEWLNRPVPGNHMRLLIIAGSDVHAEHVVVDVNLPN